MSSAPGRKRVIIVMCGISGAPDPLVSEFDMMGLVRCVMDGPLPSQELPTRKGKPATVLRWHLRVAAPNS